MSWLYISRWGRRAIWLWGSYGLVICLFLVGILSCVNPQTTALAWAESILCIVWLGVYSMSVGPIVYTIVAEIGSTRLRTQTVVLGRSMYYFANLIGGIMEPYFMSPSAWDAKGKTVCFFPFRILSATPPPRLPPVMYINPRPKGPHAALQFLTKKYLN